MQRVYINIYMCALYMCEPMGAIAEVTSISGERGRELPVLGEGGHPAHACSAVRTAVSYFCFMTPFLQLHAHGVSLVIVARLLIQCHRRVAIGTSSMQWGKKNKQYVKSVLLFRQQYQPH